MQQRQRPWSGDSRIIGVRIADGKSVGKLGIASKKRLEPIGVLRHVVDHGVEHQLKRLPNPDDIVPFPQIRIDLKVILDTEPVVGSERKTGQQMDRAD